MLIKNRLKQIMYKIRGQINSFYFNLLLLARQKELLNNYLEIIKKRIDFNAIGY